MNNEDHIFKKDIEKTKKTINSVQYIDYRYIYIYIYS